MGKPPPVGRPPSPLDRPTCRQTPPVLTSSGGRYSGRYASYWKAFLFISMLTKFSCDELLLCNKLQQLNEVKHDYRVMRADRWRHSIEQRLRRDPDADLSLEESLLTRAESYLRYTVQVLRHNKCTKIQFWELHTVTVH